MGEASAAMGAGAAATAGVSAAGRAPAAAFGELVEDEQLAASNASKLPNWV
jgi:hypothetical protein